MNATEVVELACNYEPWGALDLLETVTGIAVIPTHPAEVGDMLGGQPTNLLYNAVDLTDQPTIPAEFYRVVLMRQFRALFELLAEEMRGLTLEGGSYKFLRIAPPNSYVELPETPERIEAGGITLSWWPETEFGFGRASVVAVLASSQVFK